jgi:tRNA A37 threonylcarbamoyladenosine biosynthesis protein TsaE
MKRIIVVYGDSGSGKTTVIKDIYKNLLQNGAVVKVSPVWFGQGNRDFKAVLTYQNKKIAFMSMGDYVQAASSAIAAFRLEDILIIAYNTRHSTLKSEWLKNTSEIYIVRKSLASNADNTFVEQQVIGLI